MLTLIAAAVVTAALVSVLAFGAHARLRTHATQSRACGLACDYSAESCCRRCVLHEACGIRTNTRTGEVACRLV